MKYELAKQLKDAGFPQEDWLEGHYVPEQRLAGSVSTSPEMTTVYKPTLSELIEACGDRFSLLERAEDLFGDGYLYQAEYQHSVFGHGKTPEEAVAKLWIKLQKLSTKTPLNINP